MATNELDPNTTYYLQLITYDADPVDYILNVTDPNTPAPTSVPDSQNTLPPDGEVIAGTSQYNALLLPLNTKVFGTAEKDSYSWYSFNTGDSSGDEFRITAVSYTHLDVYKRQTGFRRILSQRSSIGFQSRYTLYIYSGIVR